MEKQVKINRKVEDTKTHCFELWVDSKKIGTYRNEDRSKFASLEHRKGVEIVDVWLTSGWLKVGTTRTITRKDKTTPPLEGIGFVPVHRK